ncbi:MAG: MgtC/SapB family protein [Polyangiaceae bacterium]|nr:MgtC/SapB family protein [Polyangiaceae bacterium]
MSGVFERVEWRLAVALAIGLIIGVERERRQRGKRRGSAPGIRTFAIASLLGGVMHELHQTELVVAGFAGILLLALARYVTTDVGDRGLTTEIALLLTYGLGTLAQIHPLPALSAGVMATFILVLRGPLHHVARELVTRRELFDAITFGVAALVVLPLVPNRAVDPWGAINPFVLWRLAVVMMAITSAGYIALRWVGPRYGLVVVGFASGFVSSSATINSMGTHAKEDETMVGPSAAGAAASTIATFIQLAILVGATSPTLLRATAIPITAGGIVAAGYAALMARHAATSPAKAPPAGRPFRWGSTLLFVGVVGVVTLVSILLQRAFGKAGALAGSIGGALADVHAAASALGAMTAEGSVSVRTTALGLMLAISTNTITKVIMAVGSGMRAYYARVLVGLALVLAASWGGYMAAFVLGYAA